MYCQMDVADEFLRAHPHLYRRRGCGCAVLPVPPLVGSGCRCAACGARCTQCLGFGYAAPPIKRVAQILSRVRSQIRRRTRQRGFPPGFVRLTCFDVRALLRKLEAEDATHWIHTYVDAGPPVRVFDVLIVTDRRRE
jgi:hypothetical protein